jgi:hypothetical protein
MPQPDSLYQAHPGATAGTEQPGKLAEELLVLSLADKQSGRI